MIAPFFKLATENFSWTVSCLLFYSMTSSFGPSWRKLSVFKAKVPNLLGARYQFCGRKIFHGLRVEGWWFRKDSDGVGFALL